MKRFDGAWTQEPVPVAISAQDIADELSKAKVCGRRNGCTKPATEPHLCPYAQDINDDNETLCDCCDDCAQECAWDI